MREVAGGKPNSFPAENPFTAIGYHQPNLNLTLSEFHPGKGLVEHESANFLGE